MFAERETPNSMQRVLIREKDPKGRTVSLGIADIKVNKANGSTGNNIDTYELVNTHWILGSPPQSHDLVNDNSIILEPLTKNPLKLRVN